MPTMLPSVPKTLGRLGDVLVSAGQALLGNQNSLGLKATDSAIVILVDGLGAQNIKTAAGHARFLAAALASNKPINTVLPSTTAAALTTLATGESPNVHGIVGYRVLRRSTNSEHNLLSGWTDFEESHGWRLVPTASQRLAESGIKTVFVGPSQYRRSGFTNVIMPSAEYAPAETVAERFKVAASIARAKGTLVYLYVPELDQAAHAEGVASQRWLNLVEDLDAQVRDLTASVGNSIGIVLTADHGIVDVEFRNHIRLDELDLPPVRFFGGDTRCGYLYFVEDNQAVVAKATIEAALGSAVSAITPAEAIEAGWMVTPAPEAADLMPDLIVLANREVAIYHRDYSSAKSYQMVGHHGSWTGTELQIPCIKLAAWA